MTGRVNTNLLLPKSLAKDKDFRKIPVNKIEEVMSKESSTDDAILVSLTRASRSDISEVKECFYMQALLLDSLWSYPISFDHVAGFHLIE